MITEFLQFWKMITTGVFYYLPLHFFFLNILPLFIRTLLAKNYSSAHCLKRENTKISVVIPEYGEDLDIFERTLRTVVENKPDEIFVIYDDGRDEVSELAKKYGAKVHSFSSRGGKRRALAKGWTMATGDIIIHVDSDEIVHKNAFNEIIKPFSDKKVMGVQGKNLVYRTGSWFSWRMSRLVELNRDASNKVLNDHLVVIDGRFNAWRRNFLLKHMDSFLNERFLGKRCETGDDRFLTMTCNLKDYKTAYQDTAVAETASPPTYVGFIRQQLRWLRSGYKAFFKDFTSGILGKVSRAYIFFQICYYMGSISFTIAMIQSFFFAPSVLSLPLWSAIPMAIFGSGVLVAVRRFAVGFYQITFKEFVFLGTTSIFLSYPLALYALITMRKQTTWGTR